MKDLIVDRTDGLRVIDRYGWMLFRPSQTENLVSIRFEGNDQNGYEQLKLMVAEFIDGLVEMDQQI